MMERRKSSRVAAIKKLAVEASVSSISTRKKTLPDRSREARAKARTLMKQQIEETSSDSECDDDDSSSSEDSDESYVEDVKPKRASSTVNRGRRSGRIAEIQRKPVPLEEMETQVVDFEGNDEDDDDGSETGSDLTGEDNDKKKTKGFKKKEETDEEEEEEDEEAKDEWLGMACGLRRSSSRSPLENKKSESKIRKAQNTAISSNDSKLTEKRLRGRAPKDSSFKNIITSPLTPTGRRSIRHLSNEDDEAPTKMDKKKTKGNLTEDKDDSGISSATSTRSSSMDNEDLSRSTKINVDNNKLSANSDDTVSTTVADESVAATNTEIEGNIEAGKLKPSVQDSEGYRLAKSYRSSLRTTEEFALDYISTEIHHPVLSSFRELTKSDVKHIIANRQLKKSLNSLEQSVLYLGMIDFVATANNSPFYGESFSSNVAKNLGAMVQKILVEFKNIIGMWALSGNDELSGRYTLIIRYLRTLVPMFEKTEFSKQFSGIIDCIEKEVRRLKSNQDKLKAMNGPGPLKAFTTATAVEKKSSEAELTPTEGASSSTTEIILNVTLTTENDSDNDDISLISENSTPKIFGKPIKPMATTPSLKKPKIKKLGTPKSSQIKGHKSIFDLSKPKKLTADFKSSSSSPKSVQNTSEDTRTLPQKRTAEDDPHIDTDTLKKRKIAEDHDQQSSPLSSRNEKAAGGGGIRSYFQSVHRTSSESTPTDSMESSPVNNNNKPKAPVNAFALMMQRSKEIAEKKKLAAAAAAESKAPSVPILKVGEPVKV